MKQRVRVGGGEARGPTKSEGENKRGGWMERRVGGSSAVIILYRTGGVGEQCGKVTLPHCSPPPSPPSIHLPLLFSPPIPPLAPPHK